MEPLKEIIDDIKQEIRRTPTFRDTITGNGTL